MESHVNDAAALNIAIIGAGGIVRSHHVPGLRALPGVTLHGLAARTPQSAEQSAEALGIPTAYPSWRDAVDDPDVHAVVLATWPNTHAEITIAALEAGKHVLCEGRMAFDHGAALAMLGAASQHPDLVTMIVPAAVTFWCDATVQRVLTEGQLGEVRIVRVVWGGQQPRRQHPWWRRSSQISGDNVMELGILVESVARWVGHPDQVLAVERLVETGAANAPDGFVADVPDHVTMFGSLSDGATMELIMSPLEPPHVLGRQVAIVGSQASLVVDLTHRTITLIDDDGTVSEVDQQPDEPQSWRVEAEFVGAIRGVEPVRFNDPATAERSMAVTSAARRAARQGCWVTVPAPPTII